MARVYRAGGALFASALCLTAGAAFADPAQTTAALNIRSGPGTMYGVRDTIPPGGTVDVADCNGGWCRVAWQGESGWVSGNYLDTGGEVDVDVVATTTTRTVAVPTRRRTVVTREPRTVMVPTRRTVVVNEPRTVMVPRARTVVTTVPLEERYVGGHDPVYAWEGPEPRYDAGDGYRLYAGEPRTTVTRRVVVEDDDVNEARVSRIARREARQEARQVVRADEREDRRVVARREERREAQRIARREDRREARRIARREERREARRIARRERAQQDEATGAIRRAAADDDEEMILDDDPSN